MNRLYQFAFKLNDLVSPTLMQISSRYSGTVSKMQRMTNKFQSMFRGASQSVGELLKKLDGLKGERLIRIGTAGITGAIKLLDILKRKKEEVEKDSSVKKEPGWLMSLARGALPALGIAGALAGAGKFATMGMDREQTKVAFEQFVGKDGVNPLMKQMNKFADVTPYSNEDVYGSGRTLLAAKVSQNELQGKMTNIGNMAAVSQKDFGELSAAYAKIKAKGFIDSGELHQEFGGTMLMDELKKNLGVNGEQLFKMAEKRQVRYEDVDKAMASLSANGGAYNGGLEKLSQTAGGKWSTFTGTFENKITEWAEKLNPLLSKAFDFGSDLLTKIDPLLAKLQPVFDVLADGFGKVWKATEPVRDLFGSLFEFAGRLFTQFSTLGGGISGLKVVFDVLAAVVWTISTAIQAVGSVVLWLADSVFVKAALVVMALVRAWGFLNVVMAANPIGAVIVGVLALVSGIKYAWDNVDGFRHAIIRMWEVAKSVFGSLGAAWDALKQGDFSGLKAALAKGWNDGLANADKAIAAEKTAKAIAAKQNATSKPGAVAASVATKTGEANKASGTSATTGGTKSTNITINLPKGLIERLDIHASGVREGVEEMERMVTDALIRVLESGSAIAST